MLTISHLRAIKPEAKMTRHYDEKGMYLQVSPVGGMYWRLKYRQGGKEKLFSIGTYPEFSLAEARARRDDARKLISDGITIYIKPYAPIRLKSTLKALQMQGFLLPA
jgi:hypothetical protein